MAASVLNTKTPYAITMWDFSWLERRWPGAGYEDWDLALDELKARGYNAVRIDAYPHLIAQEPAAHWTLYPEWNQHDWGSPTWITVQVQPGLNEFIAKAADRGIKVALSTWWRDDQAKSHCQFENPAGLARAWLATLDTVAAAGLLENILYVDLNNEFPLPNWTPYARHPSRDIDDYAPYVAWMAESIPLLRAAYPELAYTFSFYGTEWYGNDVSALDFLEPHIWMTSESDFYKRIGYNFETFAPVGYETLVAKGEAQYRQDPAYWQGKLLAGIDKMAEWSRTLGKPLGTTECWGSVVFKDWPGLDWSWEKELCELGVRHAVSTGRWTAIATSNFCGPQFRGMWRDIDWHLRLTDLIKSAPIEDDLWQ